MNGVGAATPVPDRLAELFAVVVWSDSPGDLVRWVRGGDAWEAESPWGGGFAVQGPERTVDVMGSVHRLRQKSPNPAALGDAEALVDDLRRQGMCQHCSIGDPAAHAVAPDIWGESTLLCLFRPDPATVVRQGVAANASTGAIRTGALPSQAKTSAPAATGPRTAPIVTAYR